MAGFFGLTDPYIWGAYVGCILCVVFSIVYYVKVRNSEEDEEDE